MKKLLSLLSVLTISWTAVPTTIAASPYQKEEQLNSYINYSKTSNLENIIRNKREIKYNKIITKKRNIAGSISNSSVIWNNKIYFWSSFGVIWEYNQQTKVLDRFFISNIKNITNGGLFVLNNDLYFGSFNKDNETFYKYDIQTKSELKIDNLKRKINTNNIQVNNKKYYINNYYSKLYEKDIITNEEKLIVNDEFIENSILLFNDKLYVSSLNKKVYEYNPKNKKLKIIIESNNAFLSSGTVLNDKIYFADHGGFIYEYDPLELYDSNIINMEKIVKLGIYAIQLEQNSNFNIENISNINLDNLTVSNISLKQKENGYKAFIKSENLENICQNISATFTNNSSTEQTQSTASCSEKIIETSTFQKLNGFSKTETKSDSTTTGTSNMKADKKAWSWNWNAKVGVKTKGKVGIPLVAEGEVEVSGEIGGGETRGEDTTYTNSKNEGKTLSFSVGDISNTADTKINTNTKDITITIPSQPVKIPPHNTYNIFVKSNKEITEFILSLNQKIYGKISAAIIDENYNNKLINISIKDIMSTLQKNNLLTEKITINNNDDSINFVYDVKITKETIKTQTIIE